MSTFNWVTQLVYVAAAACFVLGLHLMNTPATARRGNQLSTGGMTAAVVATARTMPPVDSWLPRRALAGEFIRCRPSTKQVAAAT